MKVGNWLGSAFALSFLFSEFTLLSWNSSLAFDLPGTHTGIPLTTDQTATVQSGIDYVAGTPGNLTWTDVYGGSHSASLDSIARSLQNELNHGDIEQETQANDHMGWEYLGGMNLENDWLNDGPDTRVLAEILIHEWVHKQQEEEWEFRRCEQCADEVEAADAELAFKDLVGFPHEAEEYKFAYDYRESHRETFWDWVDYWFISREIENGRFVNVREGRDGASDILQTYFATDTSAALYDLGPMDCGDARVIEGYFPTGGGLVLTCGTVPGNGGRLLAIELSNDGIVGPYQTIDFPQAFHTMERITGTNTWMIVDTLAGQIYRMEDANGDQLPDVVAGVFASTAQFPQIEGMCSVQYALHPLFGYGFIVNSEPAHKFHVIRPYDVRWFLVDADGDNVAESCHLTRRGEYMRVVPQIRQDSYAGEMSVRVMGTWLHDIAVYTSDESGEILIEMLGVVNLADSVKKQCALLRPLMAGEYIIPVDLVSEERSGAPQLVLDRPPEHLVIQVGPGGDILLLHWDPVPGAVLYALWASDDGEEFYDVGVRTPVNELAVPLLMNKQFYRVTAIR